MRINTIKPAPGSKRPRLRVGRGASAGQGKTCGRGHKGQSSRAGGYHKVGFEGGQMPLQMRLPKYGFSSRVGRSMAEIRTSELNKLEGDVIDLGVLRKANLITANIKRAKVMLSGDVTKAVTLKGIGASKGARAAIEAAGGKVIDEEVMPKLKKLPKKAPKTEQAADA